MANGILIAAMDFSAAPEDEFHDWYDLEHVPERLRVPGFLNAERWIGIDNPKISVATYDLDNVGVLQQPGLSRGRRRQPVALDQAHRQIPQGAAALRGRAAVSRRPRGAARGRRRCC